MKAYSRGEEEIGERVFYQNGRVAEERLFKDGQLNGPRRLIYESGKLFSVEPYRAGKLDGTVCFFAVDGKVLGESGFVQGTGIPRQSSLKSLVFGRQATTIP